MTFREQFFFNLLVPAKEKDDSSIYMILDTAQDERLYPNILFSDRTNLCLFDEKWSEKLADVAPYLIKLQQDEPLTNWLLSQGIGKNWGVFIKTSIDEKFLVLHLRNLLKVKIEDEGYSTLNFRYYDPRVLSAYLPTCNEKELNIFFGPISCYYVECNGIVTGYSFIEGMIHEEKYTFII